MGMFLIVVILMFAALTCFLLEFDMVKIISIMALLNVVSVFFSVQGLKRLYLKRRCSG
jgi:hypothetical protein